MKKCFFAWARLSLFLLPCVSFAQDSGYDYEVPYLESTSGQYINLGETPALNRIYDIRLKYPSGGKAIFGGANKSGVLKSFQLYKEGTSLSFYIGDGESATSRALMAGNFQADEIIDIRIKVGETLVETFYKRKDETEYTVGGTRSDFTLTYVDDLYLFGRRWNGNFEATAVRIYSFKVTDAATDTVLKNLIPVSSNGTYGMFDTVQESFYSNCSTTAFESELPSRILSYQNGVAKLSSGVPGFLFLASGDSDYGEDYTAWPYHTQIAEVTSQATNVAVRLTGDEAKNAAYCRLFLLDKKTINYISYLESTGSQYINLNEGVNTNRIIETQFRYPSYSGETVVWGFGTKATGTLQSYQLYRSNATLSFYVGYGDSASSCAQISNSFTADQDLDVRVKVGETVAESWYKNMGDAEYTAGGVRNDVTLDFDGVLYMFGRRWNSSAATSKVRIYSFKIFEANTGTPLKELRPAIYNGVPGMYDTVSCQWYPNSGSGTFAYDETSISESFAVPGETLECSECCLYQAARLGTVVIIR